MKATTVVLAVLGVAVLAGGVFYLANRPAPSNPYDRDTALTSGSSAAAGDQTAHDIANVLSSLAGTTTAAINAYSQSQASTSHTGGSTPVAAKKLTGY